MYFRTILTLFSKYFERRYKYFHNIDLAIISINLTSNVDYSQNSQIMIRNDINYFLFVVIEKIVFKQMKLIPCLQSFFRTFDLFSASQFLRYQQEGDYKTASGGFCSLMVLIVFGVLFMNTAIQTVNMDIINWSSSQEFVFDPVKTEIKVDPANNKFVFAIGILGVDLNNQTQRVFDLQMAELTYENGDKIIRSDLIPLVPCQPDHFGISEEIKTVYQSANAQTWLCPSIGYTFRIAGKYTSKFMDVLQVRVKKCDDTLDPFRPCASNQTIAELQGYAGQFLFTFYYVNPLINPENKEYLNYYIEDRNYIAFTTKLGAYSNGFVEDYNIQTDVSLLPFTQKVYETGIIIRDLFQSLAYQVTTDEYASFFLIKSSASTTYLRSFNKLDTFFSYVGGLVGTILGFMFIVQSFTEMSFELNLSQRLFSYSQDPPNKNFDHFSFLTYLKYRLYELLSCFGCCKNWQTMKQYKKCQEEIVKQLDIELMLHRIDFLEKALDQIFDEDQIHQMHSKKIDTISQIKKRRRRYAMRGKQSKESKVANNNQNEEQSDEEQSSDDSKSSQNPNNNTTINMKTIEVDQNYNPLLRTKQSKQGDSRDDILATEFNLFSNQLKRQGNRNENLRIKKHADRGNQYNRRIVSDMNIGNLDIQSNFQILPADENPKARQSRNTSNKNYDDFLCQN